MKTISLKQLVILGIVQSISTLRRNVNGYAYVTMVRRNEKGETESNNVYFPATGETNTIVENWVEGEKVINYIKDWELAQVENTQGEIRFKLYKPSDKYASAAEMMELFGVNNETQTDFDVASFEGGFSARVADDNQAPNPTPEQNTKVTNKANAGATETA